MLPTSAGAYGRAHLEELAKRPGTVVYDVEHDSVTDPWPVVRLRAVFRSIAERVSTFSADADDFAVRKGCLDCSEILAFQRQHPRLYWILTDRTLASTPMYQDAMRRMLEVRDKVERGVVTSAKEADALATREVTDALM